MSGIYNKDGSINVNVVDGETFVGFYSADGAMNVVDASQDGGKGIYHPCGAIRVTLDDDARTRYAPDGSMYVSTAGTGAGLFVTGDFEGGDEEPEPIHPTELEGLTALFDVSELESLFGWNAEEEAYFPAEVDDPVSLVVDLSGNGHDLNDAGFDGLPVLKEENGTYYLLFESAVLNYPLVSDLIAADEYEIYIKARHISAPSDSDEFIWLNAAVIADNADYIQAAFVRSSGKLGAYVWDGDAVFVETDYQIGTDFTWLQALDAGNLIVKLNDENSVSVSSGPVEVIGGRLLVGTSRTQFANLRLYKLAIFNKVHSDEDRAGIIAWLNS